MARVKQHPSTTIGQIFVTTKLLSMGAHPRMFAPFAEAGKRRSKAVHWLEKSVINMI